MVDPELAHRVAVKAASCNLVRDSDTDDPCLTVNVFQQKFANPIGLAAGFDKNAEAIAGLFNMGFGFVEIGSVTPLPQVRAFVLVILQYDKREHNSLVIPDPGYFA